ncbi:MAG: hypothetical protein VW270_10205 [Candidatus Poseidoniales archaeon]
MKFTKVDGKIVRTDVPEEKRREMEEQSKSILEQLSDEESTLFFNKPVRPLRENNTPETPAYSDPLMDLYVSAVKERSQKEPQKVVVENDLQNTPASMADLKNIEMTLRNVQTSMTSLGGGGLGENDVISLVKEYAPEVVLDSDHLDYLASKLDSDFKFTDSDEVIAIIHYTVDSAYVHARAGIEETVDSAYVQSRVNIPDAILKSGKDSDRTFALNRGIFLQSNNLSPQNPLTLTYDSAEALSIEKDGTLRINKTEFLDSNEVPNVGWVLRNSGDSAETIALIEEYRDSSWFTSELAKNDLDTLNDVDVPTPLQKDFLMWNGAQWVPHQQFADTGFHYKGDIDATAPNSAPTDNAHGDMWVNKSAGIVDSSWIGLGGSAVDSGDMLVYDSNHNPPEWDNFGHLGGGGGISRIYEGFGIDVDNTTPENPVVSIDTSQTDDRYLQRTGGTLIGDVTVTNGNNLLFQTGAELLANTWRSNGANDVSIFRNTTERVKLTSTNTEIRNKPLKYVSVTDSQIKDDGHLVSKSYAETNFLTNKGGIIAHGANSPDPDHAIRIEFSNSASAQSSAIEVDMTIDDAYAFRAEAPKYIENIVGYYAHADQKGAGSSSSKFYGFRYEVKNHGNNNIGFEGIFRQDGAYSSGGSLLRSTVDGVKRFDIRHDGSIDIIKSDGVSKIFSFSRVSESLTISGDIISQSSLNAPAVVADTVTANNSLTVNGNITTTGTITSTGNIKVNNPNALVTNNIKSIGNSNLTIIRDNDTKFLIGSQQTLSHQPIRYQTAASNAVGGDEKDLIDIKYAETHIAGKVRTVNNLPGTLERGVIYLTSGNVLTVGL